MTLISVVVPVFNEAQSLRSSLPSLFRQVFKEVEVIALDEGSSDGSLELLRGHERAGRLRLLRYRGQRRGRLAACNDAARRASGAWLMFFDPRDLLLFDHLSRMAAAFSRHPDVELFASAYQRMGPSGPVRMALPSRGVLSRRSALAAYARADFIQPHASCIRRERFLEMGGFGEHLRQGGETRFWLGALCELEAVHYDDTITSLWNTAEDDIEPEAESVPLHPVVELLDTHAGRLSARERRRLEAAVNRKLLDWAMWKKRRGQAVRTELASLRLSGLPMRLWPRALRLMLPPAWFRR
ncbi:glycosyltransferase family 2 protein [Halomonas sp. MCCC 1A17488]|uniref:glycosyltransferase family 2 protein n=1 Tax=unclassified Halomonas TaxID=2609666 RepID=UPI0018D26847|nr:MULTISPECIES: glycosyltransferase family A protein [unclassified Halomonas]MCE8017073.1 glycosyltransferase family 2 protein [Halomonas sp. MCCC 1A17488]MCG3240406.1 glycosyltransferase family 2 protein [Halomonas sp. MCCC 1A17488]QPP49730.1 glycosyltransferase family 2 protein [Halomonas sp. SS10-MC5]